MAREKKIGKRTDQRGRDTSISIAGILLEGKKSVNKPYKQALAF